MSEDEFIEFELNEAELAELSLFRANVRSPVPEHAVSTTVYYQKASC